MKVTIDDLWLKNDDDGNPPSRAAKRSLANSRDPMKANVPEKWRKSRYGVGMRWRCHWTIVKDGRRVQRVKQFARLAEAQVDVRIDLSAATTGDRTVNASLPGADWFDVKTTPTARFQSRSITQVKPGQYVAKGTLTLRGVSVPVSLPFTLAIAGDTATMTGQTVLDRRPFRIGTESDASGDWVAFQVPVRVSLKATRLK